MLSSRYLPVKLCVNFTRSYSTPNAYDVVVIGGGIVGLATARECIQRWPKLRYAVLEKEAGLAQHQSGHNSGVLHAGIYYQPGSLKAKLCVDGHKRMYEYCNQKNIPHSKCGKLIVATEQSELPRLSGLLERGLQNGVQGLRLIDAKEIREMEPHCVGLQAIHSPMTGIVDFAEVAKSFGKDFSDLGGKLNTSFEVANIVFKPLEEYKIEVTSTDGKSVFCNYLITCAGLHSDKLSSMTGGGNSASDIKVLAFRGDYYVLKPEKRYLVKTNIYPVPNPAFPFLGVHFTPRMDGSMWLGPNAVLSLKREGYGKFDFNLKDSLESLTFKGLRKLVLRNMGAGFHELHRVVSLSATVKDLQKFVPSLTVNDVLPGPSGVRAQALDSDGNLVDDFVFNSPPDNNHIIHVCNAPSPAATSSLAIASLIADKAQETFKFH